MVREGSVEVEIDDRGTYTATCAEGHRFVCHLGNPKFEILYEMALLAYSDGYTREAVATLAAASEEFYRFFVTLILAKRGFSEESKQDELKAFWKQVNRSEAQLGAFAAIHILEKGSVPSFPDRQAVEFRNRVIHQGQIANASEVAVYGQKILSFILPLYDEYRLSAPYLFASGFARYSKVEQEEGVRVSTHLYSTALRNLLALSGRPTFERAVEFARTGGFLKSSAT